MTAPPIAKKHHYLPASIIGEFSDSPRPRRRDSLVTFGTKGSASLRGPIAAENLFLVNDFYTLPDYEGDRLKTGLLVYTWLLCVDPERQPALDVESFEQELQALGDKYSRHGVLRPDVLERLFAEHLDEPFSDVARRMRLGHDPTEQDMAVLRRFLGTAFLRSPAWARSGTSKRMIRRNLREGRRSIKLGGEIHDSAWQDPLAVVHGEVLKDIAYLLALGAAVTQWSPIVREGRFVIQLLTTHSEQPGFVLGDNAGRAYSEAEDPRTLDATPKGMENPGSVITFPIGPRHCLRVRYSESQSFERVTVAEETVRHINTALLTVAQRTLVYPPGTRDVFLPGVDVATAAPFQEL